MDFNIRSDVYFSESNEEEKTAPVEICLIEDHMITQQLWN
jgi:hypothetical protein